VITTAKSRFVPLRACGNGLMYLCKNRLACLPSDMFCDGIQDCSDGSDESQGKILYGPFKP
jgi:hypothetical protein